MHQLFARSKAEDGGLATMRWNAVWLLFVIGVVTSTRPAHASVDRGNFSLRSSLLPRNETSSEAVGQDVAVPCHIEPLTLPTAGNTSVYSVSFDTIRDLALRKAKKVWRAARDGPPIPFVDYNGNTVAYMFNFRVDGQPFPTKYDVAVREDSADLAQFRAFVGVLQKRSISTPGERFTPPTGRFRYAHVLVSARYDRSPVLAWGEGLSEYYRTGLRVKQEAARILGVRDPILKNMVLTWPLYWFEFEAGDRAIVIHSNLLRYWRESDDFAANARESESRGEREAEMSASKLGKDLARVKDDLRTKSKQEWSWALSDTDCSIADVFVPGYAYNRRLFSDWSYGCSPTAATMVLSYWDLVSWYGLLVDYYFERRDSVGGSGVDYQVPSVQRSLATAMGTDTMSGGTNSDQIMPGMRQVTNTNNGYSFGYSVAVGSSGNDWAWSSITNAIGDGHPFVWSYIAEPTGHSMAAFGYRTPDKDLWIHITWWGHGEWKHYTDNSFISTHLCVPTPGGPVNYDVKLTSPQGDTFYNHNGSGETWLSGELRSITWNNFGVPGDSLQIMCSTDGGVTWPFLIAHCATDNGRYPWLIAGIPPSTRTRIRLIQYDGGRPVSTDGSFGNFTIAPPVPHPIDTLRFDNNLVANAWAWNDAGNGWGGKFTPPAYPRYLRGALMRFYSGWPDPGSDHMKIRVVDDDGTGGSPRTTLWQSGLLYCTRGNWKWFPIVPPPQIASGSFYLFYIQSEAYPNCPGISVDDACTPGNPWWQYRNGVYSRDTATAPASGDFMIRAVVATASGIEEELAPRPAASANGMFLSAAPNPFSKNTTFTYALPRTAEASLAVFDASGRLVRRLASGAGNPGFHTTVWNGMDDAGRSTAAGIYFCRLEADGVVATEKVMRFF